MGTLMDEWLYEECPCDKCARFGLAEARSAFECFLR